MTLVAPHAGNWTFQVEETRQDFVPRGEGLRREGPPLEGRFVLGMWTNKSGKEPMQMYDGCGREEVNQQVRGVFFKGRQLREPSCSAPKTGGASRSFSRTEMKKVSRMDTHLS